MNWHLLHPAATNCRHLSAEYNHLLYRGKDDEEQLTNSWFTTVCIAEWPSVSISLYLLHALHLPSICPFLLHIYWLHRVLSLFTLLFLTFFALCTL